MMCLKRQACSTYRTYRESRSSLTALSGRMKRETEPSITPRADRFHASTLSSRVTPPSAQAPFWFQAD
jgi:hypothetical protein